MISPLTAIRALRATVDRTADTRWGQGGDRHVPTLEAGAR